MYGSDYASRPQRPLRLPRSFGQPEQRSALDVSRPDANPLARPLRETIAAHYRFSGEAPWRSEEQDPYYSPYYNLMGPTLHGPDRPDLPPMPQPPTGFISGIKLTADMDVEAKIRMVQLLVRGLARWPSNWKRKMAASTLKHTMHGEMEEVEGMDKDTYCSVCHDEVSGQIAHCLLC